MYHRPDGIDGHNMTSTLWTLLHSMILFLQIGGRQPEWLTVAASANGHPLNEQINPAGGLLGSWWRLPCRQMVWQTDSRGQMDSQGRPSCGLGPWSPDRRAGQRWPSGATLPGASRRPSHRPGPNTGREKENRYMKLITSLSYRFMRNGIGRLPDCFLL